MASPTAAIPVQMPIARAFAAGSGYAAPTSARDVTLTTAAPTPCRPRAAMSTPIPGATPHSTEAAQKSTIPAMYARRRPKWSLNVPPDIMNIAMVRL
jgi:hypothetical protein